MAIISKRLIRLNPERILERRNNNVQQVTIIGSLLWVAILRVKYVAREIRIITLPTTNGDVGTKNATEKHTKSHNIRGRIRC